ncbi:TPA: hypothetical protein EYN09_14140 [Candidatus Poribacteria bacterium]|nr:hypothetical protein [Candidatus Poribacteria bacterium]
MRNQQSNILFICSNQHQTMAPGCYGHSEVHTPNIDCIAAAGVRFNRTYCQSPVCVPARGYWRILTSMVRGFCRMLCRLMHVLLPITLVSTGIKRRLLVKCILLTKHRNMGLIIGWSWVIFARHLQAVNGRSCAGIRVVAGL